jgi:hypothetical protein
MTEAGAKNVGRPYHSTAVEAEVTEVMIRELVFAFYGKIAKDPELGPVYTEILDEDWSNLCVLVGNADSRSQRKALQSSTFGAGSCQASLDTGIAFGNLARDVPGNRG